MLHRFVLDCIQSNICASLPDLTICKVIIVIIKSAKQIVHITNALFEKCGAKIHCFFNISKLLLHFFHISPTFYIIFKR